MSFRGQALLFISPLFFFCFVLFSATCPCPLKMILYTDIQYVVVTYPNTPLSLAPYSHLEPVSSRWAQGHVSLPPFPFHGHGVSGSV